MANTVGVGGSECLYGHSIMRAVSNKPKDTVMPRFDVTLRDECPRPRVKYRRTLPGWLRWRLEEAVLRHGCLQRLHTKQLLKVGSQPKRAYDVQEQLRAVAIMSAVSRDSMQQASVRGAVLPKDVRPHNPTTNARHDNTAATYKGAIRQIVTQQTPVGDTTDHAERVKGELGHHFPFIPVDPLHTQREAQATVDTLHSVASGRGTHMLLRMPNTAIIDAVMNTILFIFIMLILRVISFSSPSIRARAFACAFCLLTAGISFFLDSTAQWVVHTRKL